MQLNHRKTIEKRVSKQAEFFKDMMAIVKFDFKKLEESNRTSNLLRLPTPHGKERKSHFKNDEDLRLQVNFTIVRLYLILVEVATIMAITDKYAVKFQLVKNLL